MTFDSLISIGRTGTSRRHATATSTASASARAGRRSSISTRSILRWGTISTRRRAATCGASRLKFGGEWEHFDGTGYWGFFDPARVYLLSPEFLQGVGVPTALFGLPDGIIHNFN